MHGFFVILPVVLVMAAGWMLGKRRVVLPEAFAQINKAIYWVAIPALILRMTSSADMSTLADKNMVLAVYASFLLAPPFAWFAARMAGEKREKKATSTLMLIRSNTVFMGLPVVTIAVGMKGVEVLSLYLAFTFIGYQIDLPACAEFLHLGGIGVETDAILADNRHIRRAGDVPDAHPAGTAESSGLMCGFQHVAVIFDL